MNTEWKDVSLSYGLLQNDTNGASPHNPSTETCGNEINKDLQTVAPEISSSKLVKDEIVGTDVGKVGTETTQKWVNYLSIEQLGHIHQC